MMSSFDSNVPVAFAENRSISVPDWNVSICLGAKINLAIGTALKHLRQDTSAQKERLDKMRVIPLQPLAS